MPLLSLLTDPLRAGLLSLANAWWRFRRDVKRRRMSDAELAMHFETRA